MFELILQTLYTYSADIQPFSKMQM